VITIYTNNPTCPYCLASKKLMETKNIPYEYKVVDVEVIRKLVPNARTVPQIFDGDKHIGGYTEAVEYFKDKSYKNMMNLQNTGYITGNYPLFFGEDLGVVDTINSPYPVLDEFYQLQMSQIWNEFEVDLTQDRSDMLNVPRPTVDLMVLNLLWQTLVDSLANRSITGLLLEHVSNSDLEAWYNAAALFETIHARTYLHIIKQTFEHPKEAIQQIYENKNVHNRAKRIVEAFNNLANGGEDIEEKLYLALVALYMLESVNFMSSFAVTFGVAETGVFQGISQNVVLICRDELLHAACGAEILKIERDKWAKYKDKIEDLFYGILEDEMEWIDYLFSEGRQCVGLSAPLAKKYVEYLATVPAKVLGIDSYTTDVKNNPLPYMDNYTNSNKIQVAAQELQLTSYLINTITASNKTSIDAEIQSVKDKYTDVLSSW
jgi:ribonucleoside-diphosphate reductase beta chain